MVIENNPKELAAKKNSQLHSERNIKIKIIVPVRKPVVIMEIVRNAWRFTGLIRNMFQTVCGRC